MKNGILIAAIVLAILVGIGGVFITRYIMYYEPEWLKEAIDYSNKYIDSSDLLTEKYGTQFEYKLKGYEADYDKETGTVYFSGTYHIENSEYLINVESADSEWLVKEFYEK